VTFVPASSPGAAAALALVEALQAGFVAGLEAVTGDTFVARR
jgi:hypothetical protein